MNKSQTKGVGSEKFLIWYKLYANVFQPIIVNHFMAEITLLKIISQNICINFLIADFSIFLLGNYFNSSPFILHIKLKCTERLVCFDGLNLFLVWTKTEDKLIVGSIFSYIQTTSEDIFCFMTKLCKLMFPLKISRLYIFLTTAYCLNNNIFQFTC